MSQIVNMGSFAKLVEELARLSEREKEAFKPLSREDYARRAAELKKIQIRAELAANEKITSVYSSITSPDDLIPVISDEKEICFKIALRYAEGDRDVAEDIYQKALINAYLHLVKGAPCVVPRKAVKRIQLEDNQPSNPKVHEITVKNPAAWLHAIVRNSGLNECHYRKRMRVFLNELAKDLERESHRFEQPETIALRNISNEELHKIVDCLPGQWSEIINLHYFGGFEYEEIAEKLNCPSSTVRVFAKRALAMLKDVLQEKRDVIDGRIGRPKVLRNRCAQEPTDKVEAACRMGKAEKLA